MPFIEQTQYYFLSGFTAKLAGTERGITEPTPTFSACFKRTAQHKKTALYGTAGRCHQH